MRRYSQSSSSRQSASGFGLALRALGWFLVALVVLAGALVGWRYTHGHQSLSATAHFFSRHGRLWVFAFAVVGVGCAALVTWKRATAQALGLLAVLVLVSGGVGGLYLYDQETLGAIQSTGPGIQGVSHHLKSLPSVNSPAIALIAGYDHRAGFGTNTYAGSNSDTLMLVRANPQNDTVSLLSFPRDLNVPIYCGGNVPSRSDRINAAWGDCNANGGPSAVLDTMEHLTGLHINYLITLDFRAFKQIVNRLHGVYVNVDRRYYIPPHSGTSAINLHPGYQKLNGGQALSYVRYRHTDSDIYRNGRQQLFMEALKARIKSSISLSNLFLLPRLIGALKGNLQVAKAGGGPLTNQEILSYLGLADGLPPGHLVRNSIPLSELSNYIVGTADELQASPQAIHAAVWRFLHPPVAAPKHTKKPSTGPKPPTKTLPHRQVSVLVLNAGNVAGEAANTSYLLTQQGFSTKSLPSSTPANAPAVTRETTVYYDPVQPNAKDAAEELAQYFGTNVTVTQMTQAIAGFAQQAHNPLTVVAVGTSFTGKLKAPHVSRPHHHGGGSGPPAQVSPGIPVTLSSIRAENGPAHFPLMIPGKIALGATLSTDEGARLFKPLRGRQELALTFVQPNGLSYWQIEESNWNSAPILQSPTGHFVYHHQTYYLYTTGGQVQMVALRTHHATYWVVNTILNELSKNTMISIAESLRPYGK
jgi:LCP family protein required for cell wall assembly